MTKGQQGTSRKYTKGRARGHITIVTWSEWAGHSPRRRRRRQRRRRTLDKLASDDDEEGVNDDDTILVHWSHIHTTNWTINENNLGKLDQIFVELCKGLCGRDLSLSSSSLLIEGFLKWRSWTKSLYLYLSFTLVLMGCALWNETPIHTFIFKTLIWSAPGHHFGVWGVRSEEDKILRTSSSSLTATSK